MDMSLFAIPNAAVSANEVETIFERVRLWATRAERQSAVEFMVESDAVGVLSAANCFPATNNIQALLDLFDLSAVYSARDLNARIFSILERVSAVSDSFDTALADCDFPEQEDLEVLPAQELRGSSMRTLGSVCLLALERRRPAGMMFIVPGYPADAGERLVRGTITTLGGQETAVNEAIALVPEPRDLLDAIDPQLLWNLAEDGREIHFAIALTARRLTGGADCVPDEALVACCVGEGFFDSLGRNQASGRGAFANTTRERCAQLLGGIFQGHVGDFGEERLSDRSAAKRVHIGKAHQALRLMYWLSPDGEIEFANIGPKRELLIHRGSPHTAQTSAF